MTDPITICNDTGSDCLTLSAECFRAQGFALGVMQTEHFDSQAYRRVLLTVLHDAQAFFAALDALAADKTNPARVESYRSTRRTLESRLCYFAPKGDLPQVEAHQVATRKDLAKCSSCGAVIVWLLTDRGKMMPTDAESVGVEDKAYIHEKHISHFATCPNSRAHKKGVSRPTRNTAHQGSESLMHTGMFAGAET